MKQQRLNNLVKGSITDDEFALFSANLIEDGKTQAAAIRELVRNDLMRRNGTCRRARKEGPAKARYIPDLDQFRPMHLPTKVNYGGAALYVRR